MRVGIVGAGIVGLAHAWSAAKRGHSVTVFERGSTATGASIRNFGMIWPIGQPTGDAHAIALRSRDAWLQLARDAGVWVNMCGSIHLAHRSDEWAVLEEFARQSAMLGYECQLLTPAEVLQRSPAANPHGLRGGLFSASELCVNPRTAISATAKWLAAGWDVRFEFATAIAHMQTGEVGAADDRRWNFDRAIICSGADFRTLFPTVFSTSGVKLCKLQMLKTVPQPAGWKIGPHLASGLTLRHYANFAVCPSLTALKARIADETPELDRYGIHVMAAQNDAGEIILGDSHEYDAAIEPFDKLIIDELMLRELRKLLQLPDWTISERWHGIYGKHPTQTHFEAEPLPDVFVCMGTGGAGMTMSFGLAERFWERIE